MERNTINKAPGIVLAWLRGQFIEKKLATPFGVTLFAFITLALSYMTVLISMKASIGIVAGFGLLLLCALCVTYPAIGFYTTYVVCLVLMIPTRLVTTSFIIPTGLIPEYLSYLTLLGVLTKQAYRKETSSAFWSNALMIWTLVLLCYLAFQLLNPNARSVIGWFNFFRKQISFAIFIYISYCFFNSRKAILYFTNFWVILSSIEALYACKQKWIGFFDYEYIWLISDPKRYDLFVNMGFVRMFGLLSDPAAAGIMYSCSTVFVLIIALRAQTFKKRLLYYTLTLIHFLANSYTGTRTGTLMVIAGVVFYCVLTLYERRTLIFSGVFAFMITALLVVPIYDNQVINRLRSTFEGSKDASAMARDLNRALVQPYVWSHPIGGGLNTAGLVGQTYNPGHYLSMIPPDSAYMQTMMEQGPIGLALLLVFYYVILRTGIRYFYRVKDPEVKTLYILYLVPTFTLMVAQFSQLAIGQYPSVLFFYSALGILLKLHQYDTTQNEATA